MYRYFVEISYHGKHYCGWQKQPNAVSVQQRVEECLFKLFGNKKMETVGCGRTDSGVHARQFYFHFDSNQPIFDAAQFLYKLNSVFPSDIGAHDLFEVPVSLHARFSATNRTYRYFIHFTKDPFLEDRSTFLPFQPDFDKMNHACDYLIGEKDFTSFSKLHTDVKTNNCLVKDARWHKVSETQGYFEISANRFLRNMVRAVVGTLLDVGREKMATVDIERILQEKNRNAASTSAPANGLFLWEVNYDRSLFNLNTPRGI
jgi:tRNA pseudouridine38-40 synthase